MRKQEDLSEADFCSLCAQPKLGEDEFGSYCVPCLNGETDVPDIEDPRWRL